MNAIIEAVNSTGAVFVVFAWPMLVQSSLLILVLLGLDAFLRKRARAIVRYWIWMIVLVKLMLPTTLAAPTSPAYWLSDALRSSVTGLYSPADTSAPRPVATGIPPVSAAGSSRTRAVPPGDNADPQSGSAGANGVPALAGAPASVAWQGGVLLFWLAAIVVMIALLIQRSLFVRSLVAQAEMANEAVTETLQVACQQMHVRTPVVLRLSPVLTSPCVCGLIRPTILMPRSLLEKVTEPTFKTILLHELAHLKRGDLWVSCLQTIMQIVYIYHPLLWVANAAIRKVREQAADEAVLVALGQEAEDYPKTLLDVSALAFGTPALSLRFLGVAESKKALHRRIQHMLTRPIPESTRIGVLGMISVLLVAAVLLPMARAEKAAVVAQPSGAETPPKAPLAEDSNVFTDPNTGIRFTKFKGISGPSDVIEFGGRVTLSPNGKFLLNDMRVVPLDGNPPFHLVDMPHVVGGCLSPDGRKVVFCNTGAMWLIEVDPDTGRPAGPPKKLRDMRRYPALAWSPDSQKIMFFLGDNQPGDARVYSTWTLALAGGEPSLLADPFSFGLLSPDGQMVACCVNAEDVRSASLCVKAVVGGEVRKILNGWCRPLAWSADGQWLVCDGSRQKLWLVRIEDGRRIQVTIPWPLISQEHPQGGKVFFYQSSYEARVALKVVSTAGGPPADFGWPTLSFVNLELPCWISDSRSILVEAKRGEGQQGFWAVPLDKKDPVPLMIDTPLFRQALIRYFSPDGSHLLLVLGQGSGSWDFWTVPVSLAQMRATGPAVKVFGGMVPPVHSYQACLNNWSPDGSKLAFIHNGDIWVADAEGKNVLQLTKTPETEAWPIWSPDGTMILFNARTADKATGTPPGLQRQRACIVPALGGKAEIVLPDAIRAGPGPLAAWSPNGKELTLVCESEGELVVANCPISGGAPRTVARFKDLGMKQVSWLRWSPDGRFLAFVGATGSALGKVYVYQPESAKLQGLTDGPAVPFFWSPDSKWISYRGWGFVKTRPEAVLWELDVDEAVAKLAKQ